ncbi:MAG TPA: hypothetical protein VJY33_13345 [Isosphaeraceae bacterium]|nr:hypothetical protein [Isosphaeraceae bacterium]
MGSRQVAGPGCHAHVFVSVPGTRGSLPLTRARLRGASVAPSNGSGMAGPTAGCDAHVFVRVPDMLGYESHAEAARLRGRTRGT